MSNAQPSTPNDSTGLLDLFDMSLLWRRKWTLVFSVLLAAGVGAAYVSQQTPTYEVTSRILVQMERFSTEKESLLRTDRTFLITQGELVTCPVVVQPALASLRKKPAPEPDFAATDAVIRNLRVTAVDDANVLKLFYRSTDPQEAVNILRAVVESYSKYVKELQHGSIGETLEVLTQKELTLRKELKQLEEEYSTLCKESPVIGQGAEAFRNSVAMLEQRGIDLASAQRLRIAKETELEALVQTMTIQPDTQLTTNLVPAVLLSQSDSTASVKGESSRDQFLTFSADPAAADPAGESLDPERIQDRLWHVETLANQLEQKYGPMHPEMRSITAQRALWDRRLRDCKKNAPQVLKQSLIALKNSESRLKAMYDTEYESVKDIDANMLKEQHARADLQRVQGIYDTTAQQLRNLQLADEALTNGQATIMVRVIEPPDATVKLAWPRPPQFIGLCAIIGLAVGSVLITLGARITGKR